MPHVLIYVSAGEGSRHFSVFHYNGKVIVHITLCNNCFLSDVDECSEDIDGCQVHCSNTIGSYNCYCDNGYELLNSTHCTGTLYSMMKCKRLHTCL